MGERRRGQGDAVLELKDALQSIRHGHLGVIVAITDAGAAIDAQLLDDMRTPFAHTDACVGQCIRQSEQPRHRALFRVTE